MEHNDLPTFSFHGYEIPVELARKTGGGPETFESISKAHIHNLQKHIGIEPSHAVLELGCGIGRDAIPLTQILDPVEGGQYLGLDIIKPSIDWCRQEITQRHANFKFVHTNINDKLHNPEGVLDTLNCPIPLPDKSVDRVFAQSVFTHLLEREAEFYFSEIARVLKSDGLAYITLFLYDEDILKRARLTNLTQYNLNFAHQFGPGCRINNLEYPTGAVAYTEGRILKMLDDGGLAQVRSPLHGSWSGFYSDPEDGQDVVILTPAIKSPWAGFVRGLFKK